MLQAKTAAGSRGFGGGFCENKEITLVKSKRMVIIEFRDNNRLYQFGL